MVPVRWVVAHCSRQHVQQRSIETFDCIVGDKELCGSCVHGAIYTALVSTLIQIVFPDLNAVVQMVRSDKILHPPISWLLWWLLDLYLVCFNPPCEAVNCNKHVLISVSVTGRGPIMSIATICMEYPACNVCMETLL